MRHDHDSTADRWAYAAMHMECVATPSKASDWGIWGVALNVDYSAVTIRDFPRQRETGKVADEQSESQNLWY